jgi:hypothetical protein
MVRGDLSKEGGKYLPRIKLPKQATITCNLVVLSEYLPTGLDPSMCASIFLMVRYRIKQINLDKNLKTKKFTSCVIMHEQPTVKRVLYLSPDGADNLDVCPLNVLLNTMVPVQ